MSNIYSTICNVLSPLGYPVREQGTYASGDVLPQTHITYQIIDEPNNTHYDNAPASKTTRIQFALYSKDPVIKQSADGVLMSVLLPAGFLRVSGRDLPYDKETGHYGYTSDYRYFETEV